MMLEREGDRLLVRAPLTMLRACGVMEAGLRLLKGGDVVVDLSAVPEADSAALAVLLAWQREQHHWQGSLRVEHAPLGLRSIARVYGADHEIDGIDSPSDGR
jgi:phospholipid transport system transporter-binding protein